MPKLNAQNEHAADILPFLPTRAPSLSPPSCSNTIRSCHCSQSRSRSFRREASRTQPSSRLCLSTTVSSKQNSNAATLRRQSGRSACTVDSLCKYRLFFNSRKSTINTACMSYSTQALRCGSLCPSSMPAVSSCGACKLDGRATGHYLCPKWFQDVISF